MSDKFVTASCFPNLHPFCRLRFPCFQTDLVPNSALWRLTASVNGGLPCVGLTCKLSQRLLCNTCPLIISLFHPRQHMAGEGGQYSRSRTSWCATIAGPVHQDFVSGIL